MPMNGSNLGRDVSIDIVTPYGAIQIDPSMITSFTPTPGSVNEKRKGLDGTPRHYIIPDGYSGSITVERSDSTLDDWWARFEADYYAGVQLPASTITETITNADGTVSQFRYVGVMLDVNSLGERRADQPITMNLSFVASKRLKVA